jgi:hypothetical protein
MATPPLLSGCWGRAAAASVSTSEELDAIPVASSAERLARAEYGLKDSRESFLLGREPSTPNQS